ncbi:MAG: lipid-A-disaccharide synthase [Methylococcus sp.]|nr:MAG: lipid-A-disaccharide synthase [Methylococcus sp.]
MDENNPRVMIVAGEASGDQHAADLFLELKKEFPAVTALGMGGRNMRDAGIDIRFDSTDIAVIGVDGLFRKLPKIRRALRLMRRLVCEEKPDLLICVDYKEFNFKLARHAKSCGVRVLFYVSPQVWAWRPGRVKKYGRVIDHMAVIFPFEVPFYQEHQVPVTFVGHPLADKVRPSLGKAESMAGMGLDPERPIVGLLPGSRGAEIRRLLPVIEKAVTELRKKIPGIQFVVVQASTVTDSQIGEFLDTCDSDLIVVKKNIYDAIQCCDAVVTTSGTATLEVALLGIPMVIVYKVGPLTYWLGRLLVRISFIGLPNIVAGKRIVEELVQHRATPGTICQEIRKILSDAAYASEISTNLLKVREKLGEGGGMERLAQVALQMLKV